MNFVIIGNSWDAGRDNPTSKHQIALALGRKGHRVLWVDGAGIRRPSLGSGGDRAKMASKLRRGLKPAYQVAENIWRISPLIMPFPGVGAVRWMNERIYLAAIRKAVRRIGLTEPVLINFLPTIPGVMKRHSAWSRVHRELRDCENAGLGEDHRPEREGEKIDIRPWTIDHRLQTEDPTIYPPDCEACPQWLRHRRGRRAVGRTEQPGNLATGHRVATIYYCVDRWGQFKGQDKQLLEMLNRQCCERADAVIVSAMDLYDWCKDYNSNTHLIPHGVDHAHFARGGSIGHRAESMGREGKNESFHYPSHATGHSETRPAVDFDRLRVNSKREKGNGDFLSPVRSSELKHAEPAEFIESRREGDTDSCVNTQASGRAADGEEVTAKQPGLFNYETRERHEKGNGLDPSPIGLCVLWRTGIKSFFRDFRVFPSVKAGRRSGKRSLTCLAPEPAATPCSMLHAPCSAARRRIGFFGLIDERMDIDLMIALAEKIEDCELVLAGKADGNADRLAGMQNIRMIGSVPYAELPALIATFDVCIIPYKVNELTKAINPIKLREMLAAGCPVVSTALPEVAKLAGEMPEGAVMVAGSNDEFVECVRAVLRSIEHGAPVMRRGAAWSIEKRKLISDSVKDQDWSAKVEEILEMVESIEHRA